MFSCDFSFVVDERRPNPRKNEGEGERDRETRSFLTVKFDGEVGCAEARRLRRKRVGDGDDELLSSQSIIANRLSPVFLSFQNFFKKLFEMDSVTVLWLRKRRPPVTALIPISTFGAYITSLGIFVDFFCVCKNIVCL